jgi:hypothetical protein
MLRIQKDPHRETLENGFLPDRETLPVQRNLRGENRRDRQEHDEG